MEKILIPLLTEPQILRVTAAAVIFYYLTSERRICRSRRNLSMNTAKTLHNMGEGTSARVKTLLNDGDMRRRLQDMGLIEGTTVLCLQRSPSGDPIAYLIRGAVIALREEDSSKILVE